MSYNLILLVSTKKGQAQPNKIEERMNQSVRCQNQQKPKVKHNRSPQILRTQGACAQSLLIMHTYGVVGQCWLFFPTLCQDAWQELSAPLMFPRLFLFNPDKAPNRSVLGNCVHTERHPLHLHHSACLTHVRGTHERL